MKLDQIYRMPQTLSFVEPLTNVEVVLVGSMHYNPISINLAFNTCSLLAEKSKLASVVVESCPVRWNKTLALQSSGSVLRKILDNEMQAAADVAVANGVPVVLGDQDISSTNRRIAETFKQSLIDIVTPWKGGWRALYNDITEAANQAVPLGNQYLGFSDFLNPKLILGAPVSLLRYPLAFIAKSPLLGLPTVLALTYALMNSGDSAFVGTTPFEQFSEVFSSGLIFGLEMGVFARVFLVALLAERNEILAANILLECKRIATTSQLILLNEQSKGNIFGLPLNIFKVDKSRQLQFSENENIRSIDSSGKVIVAVLGMAHVNGVRNILLERVLS
eukprot:gene10505-21912_t